MGVKSTVHLTRENAVSKYLNEKARRVGDSWRLEAEALSDTELEDILEQWNDERCRDELGSDTGFDNYLIVPEEDLDR